MKALSDTFNTQVPVRDLAAEGGERLGRPEGPGPWGVRDGDVLDRARRRIGEDGLAEVVSAARVESV